MEIFITVLFMIFIVWMTVYFMGKVLTIACKRGEITRSKYFLYLTLAITAGLLISTVILWGMEKVFESDFFVRNLLIIS